MKKTLITLLITILMIGCNREKKTEALVLDLNLKCNKVFYTEEEGGFNVAFQISYQNNSDYTILIQDTVNRIVSRNSVENTRGFVLKNDYDKEDYSIKIADLDNKHNYLFLNPNINDGRFYLYLYGRYGIKRFIDEIKHCYIQYNGGNLSPATISENIPKKTILFNLGNIKIDLDSVKLIKVSHEDMVYQQKLDKM
ncbi:MAG: hypothetical protein DI588_14715 [Flavobacterium johnsoniae]|nr:MAG: hypothetical protein DI588_14715 [Flavobacterium johnsoniae]